MGLSGKPIDGVQIEVDTAVVAAGGAKVATAAPHSMFDFPALSLRILAMSMVIGTVSIIFVRILTFAGKLAN